MEMESPEVIADHWLPILQGQSHLVECHPNKFTGVEDRVPLYTPDSLQRHFPVALSAFVNTNPPSLMAVVPPEFSIGMDKKFLLTNFYQSRS